jgi:soluble lytic murein transglycosylase-like protein
VPVKALERSPPPHSAPVGWQAGWARRGRALLAFLGEILASPALLVADLLHRDRTLTRRSLIAYLVLLGLVSGIGWSYLLLYRRQVEDSWQVIGGYWDRVSELPASLPYADLIRLYSVEQGLDPGLVASVIFVESSFRATAVSRASARGLMQIRPATWRELNPKSICDGQHPPPACGTDCIFDPGANIRSGCRYLRRMLDDFGGNFIAAFAAYNAGATAVRVHSPADLAIPPFPETENYVRQVLARWAELRASHPDTSPVRRLAYPGQISFVPAGISLGLWAMLLAWAAIKGRRTGHPDALI